ncbi:histidine kinase [Micromonospora sp. NPDC049559]|uniref:sensor histidine kinase n=1 Tax=Micromonospora sp. NPDC049559 TaxID=3155923 RepID=UPI0034317E5B
MVGAFPRGRTAWWDLALWAVLVAVVAAESWPHFGQLAAGVGWSGLVVLVGRWRPGSALLLGTAANLVQLAELSGSRAWPVLVSAAAGLLAGRRMGDTLAAAAIFSGVGGAGLLVAAARGDVWRWLDVAVPLLFFGVLPWLAGRYARLRALLAAAGWERAERLERERRLVAREARLRERTRIARDMHDSLGHELSLIAMRAGALELDRDLGERYRTAIGELRATSVEATERLREILGVLRDEAEAEAVPVAPAGERVEELVARWRPAGTDVELVATGTPGAVPPLVDRTAYRVVQEALTNAARHAPGAPVAVRLHHGATTLTVTVTNGSPATGAPPPPEATSPTVSGGGHGLLGLRERVRLVGGSLRAGGRSGGYEVVAELPYAAASAGVEDGGRDGGEDGVGATPEAGSPSARHLSRVRRAARRGMVGAVAVPVVIGTAVFLVLLVLRWYEVTHSVLDPAAYDAFAVGAQRGVLAGELPPRQVDGRPRVPEPPVPAGARCEYYRTTRDLFAGPIDVFRLCFAEGRLVDKTVVPGTAR